MSGWYYADRNREQHGPVSSDELVTHYRFGRVALDSLVWREGLPHWQPLSDFADELGLNPAPVETPGTPPPVPPAAPGPSAATAAPQDRLRCSVRRGIMGAPALTSLLTDVSPLKHQSDLRWKQARSW